MKKSDMKSYMIVVNGYGDMLLLLESKDIDNDWFVVGTPTEEELDEDIRVAFYKGREFNDDLININDPIASITYVYYFPVLCYGSEVKIKHRDNIAILDTNWVVEEGNRYVLKRSDM